MVITVVLMPVIEEGQHGWHWRQHRW